MDNLVILENIENNKLSFSNDKLDIDNRYFVYYREKYCIDTIIKIIEDSFNEVIENENKNENIENLNHSLEGLNKLIKNDYYNEDEKIKLLNLYDKLNKIIKELESNDTNTDYNNIDIETEIEDNNKETNIFNYISNYVYDSFLYVRNFLINFLYE